MPNQDKKPKPSIKEQREAIDQELVEYDKNATTRHGNTYAARKNGTMDKAAADADAKLIDKGRQEILDRRKELGADVKVGDKEAKYASKDFNQARQPQSREELMRQYRDNAHTQSTEDYQAKPEDHQQKNKPKDIEKDDPENDDPKK